jgi:peptidoglycan-N-acetylglucosamine deacetylase
MASIHTVVFCVLAFISVYIQIFFLVTFFEKHRNYKRNPNNLELSYYPTVTIAVPVYNEESTIIKTIESILFLDYPKDKLKIFIIDDGSKDKTWEVIQEFRNNPIITLLHKENGGKHTAINLALEKTDSEFFACLDSDSFVHSQALKRILKYFENDPETMAVVPSIIVHNPKKLIQIVQKAEYEMSVYIKHMLGLMGGMQTTPGPLSTFRKKVFDELGYYRKAHNTEDQEMALRLQENGYKIGYCLDAFVYTNTPNSISKLYKQRVRWIYGFIKNLFDYKKILFRKKYGSIALFTLPSGIVAIFGIIFIFVTVIYNIINFLIRKFIQIQTIGFENLFNFDYKFEWFFVNTKAILFFSIILYLMIVISLTIGRKLSTGKAKLSVSMLYYIITFSLLAPLWMLKGVFNAIISKESNWAFERKAIK